MFQLVFIRSVKPRVHRSPFDMQSSCLTKMEWFNDIFSTCIFEGGVACSLYLRLMLEQLCERHAVDLFVPPSKLCSDNGIMIAWNGMEHFRSGGVLVLPDNLDTVESMVRCVCFRHARDKVSRQGTGHLPIF